MDWQALERLSERVRNHIRRRLAVARVPGRPVLPEAYKLARSGYALKEFMKSPAAHDPPAPFSPT